MGYAKRTVDWGHDLYVVWLPEADVVKIGRSCDCARRFKHIQQSCPFLHMELAAVFPGSGWAEGACHRALDTRRCGREWFRVSREDAIAEVNSILSALGH
jgi:hypothetical protein